MLRIFLLALVVLCGLAPAFGQTTTHISADELRQLRLPDVVLEKVDSLPAETRKTPRAAAHLQIQGVIGGNIRFELLLPDTWNGRFVMGGGGGFVGSVQNAARDSVNRGYATVGTDTGHEYQPGYMAGWARDNVEAQLNFGYLAVHRTAEVAKALTRAYYRADPAHCYFVGCSRGGGQAMMESQRYPKDFDGIVAGAPAFNWTGIAAMSVSIAKALYPDPAHLDHTVLDKEALQKLRQGILDQCDEQDGLKDGIIADPPSAHLTCPGCRDSPTSSAKQSPPSTGERATDRRSSIPDTAPLPNAIPTNGSPGSSAPSRRWWQKTMPPISYLPLARRSGSTWSSISPTGTIRPMTLQIMPGTRAWPRRS